MAEAQTYRVHPIALAGLILGEAALNRKAIDWLEDAVVGSAIRTMTNEELDALLRYSDSHCRGAPLLSRLESPFNWTVGISQIQSNLAVKLENDEAIRTHRAPLDQRETIRRLLTPEGSIHYAAVYLDTLASDYKSRFGWDVRDNPAILATLYNIGIPRPDHVVSPKDGPKPNAFGRFVWENTEPLARALGL